MKKRVHMVRVSKEMDRLNREGTVIGIAFIVCIAVFVVSVCILVNSVSQSRLVQAVDVRLERFIEDSYQEETPVDPVR